MAMSNKQEEIKPTFTASSSLFQMWVTLVSLVLGIVFGMFADHTIYWFNHSITTDRNIDLYQGWRSLIESGVPEMVYVAQGIWCFEFILVLLLLSLCAHKNDSLKANADVARLNNKVDKIYKDFYNELTSKLPYAIENAFKKQGISQDIAKETVLAIKKHNNQ